MKILSPEKFKNAEEKTAEIQNLKSIDLMERAAYGVLIWLKNHLDLKKTHFTVFCGVGNNGGDGLALARMLKEQQSNVRVYLIEGEKYSENNLEQQKRLRNSAVSYQFIDSPDFVKISPFSIVIDALFGYGLSRPVTGLWSEIINLINQSETRVISIDLPSGLFCEKYVNEGDAVVNANTTLTFQTPKQALLFPENEEFVGEFFVLDIGMDLQSIENEDSKLYFVGKDLIPFFYRERKVHSHKYNYGNLLIAGGSYGKIGAIHLACNAALRTGAGLVTAYVPKCGYAILQTNAPEVMVMTDFSQDKIIEFPKAEGFDVLAIGPGLGTNEKTAYCFQQFLEEAPIKDKKMIIDADGITLLGKNIETLKHLPKNTILTPHSGELKRLIGSWRDSYEKLEKLSAFCANNQLIVVAKGAYTQTVMPGGEVYINSTGNPGMATAGSGDVLTGMIAALLGKGFTPGQAAVYGVFLHGLSGDIAKRRVGEESIIASDIIKSIPKSYKKLFS